MNFFSRRPKLQTKIDLGRGNLLWNHPLDSFFFNFFWEGVSLYHLKRYTWLFSLLPSHNRWHGFTQQFAIRHELRVWGGAGSGRRVHQRRNELTRIRKTPQERNEKNKSRQEHVRERRRRALAGFIILKNSLKKIPTIKKKRFQQIFQIFEKRN